MYTIKGHRILRHCPDFLKALNIASKYTAKTGYSTRILNSKGVVVASSSYER